MLRKFTDGYHIPPRACTTEHGNARGVIFANISKNSIEKFLDHVVVEFEKDAVVDEMLPHYNEMIAEELDKLTDSVDMNKRYFLIPIKSANLDFFAQKEDEE